MKPDSRKSIDPSPETTGRATAGPVPGRRASGVAVGLAALIPVFAVLAIIGILALATGCYSSERGHTLYEYPLADGRTVLCIDVTVAISCDWENAR